MNNFKRFTRLDEVPFKPNSETSGNPNDQGGWKSLIDKQKGSRDLCLGVGWLKPGETHPRHHHPKTSEFYYILEGTATVYVEDEEINATPGTAIYISRGEKHMVANEGKEQAVILFGYSRPDWITVWDE